MKKLISGLLALCMVFVFCVPAMAAEGSIFPKVNTYGGQFADVDPGRWDGPYIKIAYEYGLMAGKDGTHFDPGGTLTAAEAVALASRIHSAFVRDGAAFTPGEGEAWYQPYLDYAQDNGIAKVKPDFLLKPIMRASFAYLISRAIPLDDLPMINRIYFPAIPDLSCGDPFMEAAAALHNGQVINMDDPSTSYLVQFYREASGIQTDSFEFEIMDSVYRLYNGGILSGSDQYGTFHPSDSITRGAVAVLVSRVVEPSLRQQITLTRKSAVLVPMYSLVNLSSLQERAGSDEVAQAYEAARKFVEPLSGLSREAQLCGIALALRIYNDTNVSYSMSAPHYSDPYGFFVLKSASCAGATRAVGLCLNMLGIPYEHVNVNQYSHQWARVNVNGSYWICDAYGLYCGPEPAPYQHPNMQQKDLPRACVPEQIFYPGA